MPLAVVPLISSLNATMSKLNPSADIFGTEFGAALNIYVKPIINITGGTFVSWADPTMSIISATRVLNPNSQILATQLGKIIELSFRSIYTRNQLRIDVPMGMLPGMFSSFFSTPNPSNQILGPQIGAAIDSFARSIIITSMDVTSGYTPVSGPIL